LLLASQMILAGLSHAAEPNWYAKGLQAEYAGDYQTAITHYTKSANTGLSDASFAIARLHRTLGDDSSSLEWFLKAANAGNKFAQYEVGLVYLNGSSATVANRNEAIKWFTFAANAKQGEAAYELFKLLKDIKWLKEAAQQGVSVAMQDLSSVYEKGLYGSEVNMDESNHWTQRFIESREQGVEQ